MGRAAEYRVEVFEDGVALIEDEVAVGDERDLGEGGGGGGGGEEGGVPSRDGSVTLSLRCVFLPLLCRL